MLSESKSSFGRILAALLYSNFSTKLTGPVRRLKSRMVPPHKRFRTRYPTHMRTQKPLLKYSISNGRLPALWSRRAQTDDECRRPSKSCSSTEAQNAKWAKLRGEFPLQLLPVISEEQKRKRKTSAAGRKAISEAIERRWSLKRAEAQKPQPTASKKAAVKKTAGKKSQKNARRLQSCL